MADSTDKESPASSAPAIGHKLYAICSFLRTKLPAGFPIEICAACLPRFHFPGLQQGRLPIFSHLDDEIRKA